jgi:WD40 repeat protein
MAAGALPDGTAVIVSGGSDRTVRMWRMADGVPLGRPLTGHTGNVNAVAVGTLRDGTAVIVSGGSDRTVRVWRMADGLSMGEPLTGHSDRVTAVAIAPDGTWLASAGDDQTVRIWDSALATGHRQRALAKPVEMTERPLGPTGN